MKNIDTHPHWLMVYGTLKRGHGNNPLLVRHESIFVAPAVTSDKFLLNEGFPVVSPHPNLADERWNAFAGHVRGDLYRVTDAGLRACDALEGHPTGYCRTDIAVEYDDEDVVDQEVGAARRAVAAGIYLQPLGRYMNLQKPDKDGFLEWGRDRRTEARDFQSRSAARRRDSLSPKK